MTFLIRDFVDTHNLPSIFQEKRKALPENKETVGFMFVTKIEYQYILARITDVN